MLWLTTSRLRRWCRPVTLLSAFASPSSTTRLACCVSRTGQNNHFLVRKVTKSCSDDLLVYLRVCVCRHFQDAAHMFSLAIQYNPTSSQYYENRAKAFRKLLNLEGARLDFIRMLILDPTNEEVRASSCHTDLLTVDTALLNTILLTQFELLHVIHTYIISESYAPLLLAKERLYFKSGFLSISHSSSYTVHW